MRGDGSQRQPESRHGQRGRRAEGRAVPRGDGRLPAPDPRARAHDDVLSAIAAARAPIAAFDAYGIELEYMIVDRESLAVRPIADRLLKELARGRAADAAPDPADVA